MVVADVQGIVDSDTLPLNVSREMLQAHSSLKTIKKKLVRKALDMIRRVCEEDPDQQVDSTEDVEGMIYFLSRHSFHHVFPCVTLKANEQDS